MQRRKFIASAGASASIALAGCAGDSGIGGAPFDLEFDDGDLIATYDRDDDIDEFQILASDGSQVDRLRLGDGAESRVIVLSSTIGDRNRAETGREEFTELIDEELEIVALDSEGDEIGSVEFVYSPHVDLADFIVNTEEQQFEIVLHNVGDGLVEISPVMEITEGVEIEPVEIETTEGSDTDSRLDEIEVISEDYLYTSPSEEYTISDEEEKEISLEYDDRFAEPDNSMALGETEDFYNAEIEDAADVDEELSFVAELDLEITGDTPTDLGIFELEFTVDGITTDIDTIDYGSVTRYVVTYLPGDIAIESFEEI